MKLLSTIAALACLSGQALGRALSHEIGSYAISKHPRGEAQDLLQNVVTWDNQSLYIHGERLMVFSGEIHPFRLPVQSLYLDLFQKVKALGFNTVSFYVDWALLEGNRGTYRGDGLFDLQPFFDAASQAGIYLLARPGPYINAEVSGGGFPGWLARVPGTLRSGDPEYMKTYELYLRNVARVISKNQITNGGPVILYQPENEYTPWENATSVDPDYMQNIMDSVRAAGVVIPFINNDQWPAGNAVPGSGVGAVDIYGFDAYPFGSGCENPSSWPSEALPTYYRERHKQQSPSTPLSIVEFQGGFFDAWGGSGYDGCGALFNDQFQNVFYKNNLAAGAAIMNLYMIYGGTNWGNLGHPGGYSSYDYGAAISETREIKREKYSALKLIGNFLKASPSYLDAVPGNASTRRYTQTTDLTVTPLIGQNANSSFFVVRHTDYTSNSSTNYTLKVPTSAGTLSVPQLGGSLTLNGRDSKIHVTDYDVGGTNVLYSTAEVLTWKKFHNYSVLIVYGGRGEHHEIAVSSKSATAVLLSDQQSSILTKSVNGQSIISWDASPSRFIVKVGNLLILLLDRNSAYNYWVPQLDVSPSQTDFTTKNAVENSIIVKAGYLVRTAYIQGDQLHLTADFNATTDIEVIGAPASAKSLYINGEKFSYNVDPNGFWSAKFEYSSPNISLPELSTLEWKYINSLPEVQPSYNDSAWVSANHNTTNNTVAPLRTPASLYSSDYGFHTGSLLYRGHFVANGLENLFTIQTQGGTAYGSSVWLNQTFIGSWVGSALSASQSSTFNLPSLEPGASYVLTIIVDSMGLDQEWRGPPRQLQNPRGILDYNLSGHAQDDISWKVTGNLGGEDYVDLARGPLNEGGLYVERQGWHQPKPPSEHWETSSPFTGLYQAGIGFYSTSFKLDLPSDYDIPLFFVFSDNSATAKPYRVQLYVNGYQFGKFMPHIGPQTEFPVPQGVLNHQGENWVALTLWAQDSAGANLAGLHLAHSTPVRTALGTIAASRQPAYKKRTGAY
ncbi:glycoside hydrolase family 35 protein [Aspergillus lucknowensis]|uniref:Beta-galactosidase n=1 Tax=Aspergillus lucknowensis TaxID=176173 RepID=A0ABR4LY99_9EURO